MLSVRELVMYPYLICDGDGAHNKALCGPFSHGTINGSIWVGAKRRQGQENVFLTRSGCPLCRIGSVDGCAAPEQGRGRMN